MRKDAQANRQRLLEAADRMFREHGVEVSVGEIADAAGVGRGTLFRNFKNKDELIAAVLAERLGEVLDFGRDLLERGSGRRRGDVHLRRRPGGTPGGEPGAAAGGDRRAVHATCRSSSARTSR